MKDTLWLDLETRSRADLKKRGAYVYTECPDHAILVAGYALGRGKPKAALVGPGSALPVELMNMLNDKRLQIRAHNAAFDRLQLEARGFHTDIERWYCTAAQARAIALPGSLDKLGRAIGAVVRKDPRGEELIKLLSIPQADGTFCNDPKLLREFANYCARDIETMRECSLCMPDLDDEALATYHASEIVNDRGMPINTELCRLAVGYAKAEAKEAAQIVVALSKGALRTVRGTKLRDWVYARLDPVLRKHMGYVTWVVPGMKSPGATKGSPETNASMHVNEHTPGAVKVGKISLAADVRATLLAIAEEEPDAFDPDVLGVIEAAEAGALTSTGKFQTMLNRVSSDGRLRGAFVFNGAYQTNRWSSTGAQVHNFPRLCAKDPEAVLKQMRSGAPLDGTLRTLKSMLRPAISPGKGGRIVRADWSAIEARGLPWLADSEESRRYMAAFTEKDRDIYIEQSHAAGLGGERQPGKVVVLSLGYGGAKGALAKMAKNYGVRIENPDAVVMRWRAANGWAASKRYGWWAALDQCAFRAMRSPGKSFHAGRVSLCKLGVNLTMTLPSGRQLHYPMATIEDGQYGPEIQYLKASREPKVGHPWPRGRLWHGIEAENATQAACADLLRHALVKAVKAGLPVVGHVHDEVICEARGSARAAIVGADLRQCMLAAPAWAEGLPLAVEVDIAPHFRK